MASSYPAAEMRPGEKIATWDISTREGRKAFSEWHMRAGILELEDMFRKLYSLACAYAQKENSFDGFAVKPLSWIKEWLMKDRPDQDYSYRPYPGILTGWGREEVYLTQAMHSDSDMTMRLSVVYVDGEEWGHSRNFYWVDEDKAAYLYYRLAHLVYAAVEDKYARGKKKVDFRKILKAFLPEVNDVWYLF